MKISRRILFAFTLLISLCLLAACSQEASQNSPDSYPTKPVKMLIGLAPGGSTDLSSRAMADAASKVLGQPVVAENREGGATAVALSATSKEKPDGYSLGILISSAGAINPHLREVPYDPVNDFKQICRFGVFTYTLSVKSDASWQNLEEFLTYAKENPGKVKYGVSTSGSSPMIAMEQLAHELGIKWEHVPLGTGAKAVAGVLGGHVDACAVAGEDVPHVESGDMRVLAILSSEESPNLPGVKTLMQSGYDVAAPAYLTVVAPKDIPESKVSILEKAFEEGVKDPDFIKVMNSMNIAPAYLNSNDTEKYVKQEFEKFGEVLKNIGLVQ